jgi:hypothetical protein
MSSGGTSIMLALAGIAPSRATAKDKTKSAGSIRDAFFMSDVSSLKII